MGLGCAIHGYWTDTDRGHQRGKRAGKHCACETRRQCRVPFFALRNATRLPEAAALYSRAVADQSLLPVILRDPAEPLVHPNLAATLTSGVAGAQQLCRSAANVWASLKAGSLGAVLAFASADPYAAIAVWEAFRTREEEAGIDWQARLVDHASIPALKVAMDRNGYYGGPPRLPLSAIPQSPRW